MECLGWGIAVLLVYFAVSTILVAIMGRNSIAARYSLQGLLWRFVQWIDPHPSDNLFDPPLGATTDL